MNSSFVLLPLYFPCFHYMGNFFTTLCELEICGVMIIHCLITCFRDILHRIFFGRGLCLAFLFLFGWFFWFLHRLLILRVWKDKKVPKWKEKEQHVLFTLSPCFITLHAALHLQNKLFHVVNTWIIQHFKQKWMTFFYCGNEQITPWLLFCWA